MSHSTQPEVLFTITRENLESGLRGVPIGYCTTSTVHPEKGLFYVEHPVEQVVTWEPEEAIYLLYYGRRGSEHEVKAFTKNLRERATLTSKEIAYIQALPREGHPMQLFSAALLVCGMVGGKDDYREDCLNLIAKIPAITAVVINHHAGWPLAPSKPELGYIENFVQMLGTPNKNEKNFIRVFKFFNVLHYDHGGGNLSTFVAKAVASGLEDMYGSIVAGMNALAGPLHGRANQACLAFVKETLNALGENATPKMVEDFIRQKLAKKELIFGFGHAVLRVEDPRATVQYELANKLFPNDPLVKIANLLRTEGTKVLKENPKISDPYPNVDAISGSLLSAMGFPYPEYYTVLFGMARTVGISIQIVYERFEARDGKGTPIMRPKYIYKPRG